MACSVCQTNSTDLPTCVHELLTSSIACGNEGLDLALRSKVNFIVNMNNGCSVLIDYLTASLQLAEEAMMFTRGMIDKSRAKSRSISTQTHRATNEADSQAQRVSDSKTCSFGQTSSFQQFRRDDVQASRAESKTDSYAHGETWTNSWNLGRTWASGYSNINDWSYANTEGDGHGEHNSVTQSFGQSFSKTNQHPAIGYNDIDPGYPNLLSVIGKIIQETLNVLTSWEIKINWSGIIFGGPGGLIEFTPGHTSDGGTISDLIDELNLNDPVDDNYINPGSTFTGSTAYPSLACCCNSTPTLPDCTGLSDCEWESGFILKSTYGRGYNVDYKIDIVVPALGDTVSARWSNAEQFQQKHVVSKLCSNASGLGTTSNLYAQHDYAESYGRGRTHDENHARNDAHVISRSQRDSFSDMTSGSSTTGDSESKSESGSDQKAHNEASSKGTGTRHSISSSVSKTINRGESEGESETVKWSQVFKQLTQLWITIMDEISETRKINSQSIPMVIGKIEGCAFAVPSDPILGSKIRSMNTINSLERNPSRGLNCYQ